MSILYNFFCIILSIQAVLMEYDYEHRGFSFTCSGGLVRLWEHGLQSPIMASLYFIIFSVLFSSIIRKSVQIPIFSTAGSTGLDKGGQRYQLMGLTPLCKQAQISLSHKDHGTSTTPRHSYHLQLTFLIFLESDKA